MNKLRVLFFAVAAILSGCNNVYIQELLRGPATLDSIGIMASDGHVYSSRPDFRADVLDYEVRVPYDTRDIQIIAGARGKVYFTVNGETNTNGKFLFTEEKEVTEETINIK